VIGSLPRLAAALLLLVLPAATAVRAEQLVTALSNDSVSITSNFTGSRVVVFGTIERDAQTVSRASSYEVVVIVAGPLTDVVARRKERTVGLWINRDSERMRRVPSFLAVMSTSPLSEIATDTVRARLGLGIDMLPINATAAPEPPVRTDFEEAFLRLMLDGKLYQQVEDGVEFLSSQLFRAPVALPANVPVGNYTATVFLFRDGALLSTTTEDLTIGKVGFEQWMTDFAHRHGLWYGLATVLVAVLTGWLAGVVFRRD
jgi:uncharacterized protein (TIGR02186 family)